VRLLEEKELRSLEAHRFGASDDFGESDLLHRPVVIELEKPCKIRVEVTGRTNRILPGASGSVLLVPKEELDEKHTLRGFLDHALLAAAGVECAEKRFRVITIPAVHPGGFDPEQPFVPFTTEEARKWLTDLLEDYLGERHDYLLAYEPVLEFLRDGDPENPLFDKILWWRDKSYKKKPADAWGPVKNWQDYDPPADAEAKAVRRLWPYVKRAQGEE
jgi:hypothetical protein